MASEYFDGDAETDASSRLWSGTVDASIATTFGGIPVEEHPLMRWDDVYYADASEGGPRIMCGEVAHLRWQFALRQQRYEAQLWLERLLRDFAGRYTGGDTALS